MLSRTTAIKRVVASASLPKFSFGKPLLIAYVERGSLGDLKRILELARKEGLTIAIIGGYAVRAYTKEMLRYTKDIDLIVKRKDLPKLRWILGKLGYSIRGKPYGLSGYKKVSGVAIVINAGIGKIRSVKRMIRPFYSQVSIEFKARVASIEDLLILKMLVGRERDLVDICLLILDSFDLINSKKLKLILEE